jgi:DNA-3-methyladenine glycosylase II
VTVQEAEGVLAADPVFGGLIERWGPCPLGQAGQRGGSHFEALARSVTGQQLAGAAVQAIWLRVRALVPGRFTPDAVAALTFEQLRGAGLSGAKARTIADLAARVVDGRLRLASIARLPDDELVADLSEVWGIGRWTAEMFAMFQLGRLDIWPTGDLGVRNGYGLAHDLPTAPTPAALEAAGERFRPWRSVVAWYCWRAVEESRGVPPTRVLAVPTDQ